jgi:hypothetical protein
VREDAPGVGSGIEVVQGVPFVLAASNRLAEIHVIKGVGTKVVTSVTLPAPGRSHGLVVVRRVVIHVDVLLLTIVQLGRA